MNTLTKAEEATVLKMRADEFNTLTKGIPNYIVARLMTEVVRGVNFSGCTKSSMRESWVLGEYGFKEECNRVKFVSLLQKWRDEEEKMESKIEKGAFSWEVGEEVTVFDDDLPQFISKVDLVSKKIVRVDSTPFRLDGSRRSQRWNRIEKTTAGHRAYFARREIIGKLVHAPWHDLTMEQLKNFLVQVTTLATNNRAAKERG